MGEEEVAGIVEDVVLGMKITIIVSVVVVDESRHIGIVTVEVALHGLHSLMRSLCELLHLTALDSREGEIAIHALIVFIDDAGIETAVGKHVGYDLVVGCTLIGNLCRRTNDVVAYVAQLVKVL